MKLSNKKIFGFLLALAFVFTGIPSTEAHAAAKPVIQINGATVSGTSCQMEKGQKIRLAAKSRKKNITKKGVWKSSRKNVAIVSKKGVLSAKKAGTANITVKYKGKTSKKLKVVVINNQGNPTNPSDPTGSGNGSEAPSTPGSHKITYNLNSTNSKDKLIGSATQSVSSEILKFNTTVNTGSSGKKFLGWFTKKDGGQRVYETYKPTADMTLYAHYTDENVQEVAFSLGCNYGDTYSFIGMGSSHDMDYDWTSKKYMSGPMNYDDNDNVTWKHSYAVDPDKKSFAVDNLPIPEVPGYTFVGWYTQPQDRRSSITEECEKIENGTNVNSSVTRLYARFSKKVTVSFDDLRGGKYDDIKIDTYQSFKDSGKRLPVPEVEGMTFLGWTIDPDHAEDKTENMLLQDNGIVDDDTYFFNCFAWKGYACSGCDGVSKFKRNADLYDESGCRVTFTDIVTPTYTVFEEADHITLYPVYHCRHAQVSFDPNGGYFLYNASENAGLVYDDDIDIYGYSHESVAHPTATLFSGMPYGNSVFPGHESEPKSDLHWAYGNYQKTMPKVTRRNYVFDKWVYYDKSGKECEFTYDTILTDETVIIAKWTPGLCTVRYDSNGGTIAQSEQDRLGLDVGYRYSIVTESTIRKDGKEMPIPVSSEGRKFEGWYTIDGVQVDENTVISVDTVLFAHWGLLPKDMPVTLKFYAGGGTFTDKGDGTEVEVKSKTITRKDKFGQFFQLEERQDYDFLGWYILKPDATEPYTEDSFMQKASETTSVQNSMINDRFC
ncbi:MAG: InlB B-repeat-containing protein [Roseburia sp.]|nr:InlB B-repeat-containing protein [Roseburia sp.]